MKFGVDPLPRLLRRRRRAARPPRGSARPSLLWHADRDLQGVDAVIVPGGFSYGDYLRAGAIARFAPVMDEVIEFARAGGLRAGDLQRLPGPVRGGPAARRAAAERVAALRLPPGRSSRSSTPTRPFTRACEPGAAPVDPGQAHDRALLRARRRARPARGGRAGGAALRARPEPERLAATTSPGVCNERGNVFGLMPHPEHAVDPLTGSTDGLKIFESIASACRRPRRRLGQPPPRRSG